MSAYWRANQPDAAKDGHGDQCGRQARFANQFPSDDSTMTAVAGTQYQCRENKCGRATAPLTVELLPLRVAEGKL
jgi:hypothetical protein